MPSAAISGFLQRCYSNLVNGLEGQGLPRATELRRCCSQLMAWSDVFPAEAASVRELFQKYVDQAWPRWDLQLSAGP